MNLVEGARGGCNKEQLSRTVSLELHRKSLLVIPGTVYIVTISNVQSVAQFSSRSFGYQLISSIFATDSSFSLTSL